MLPAVVEAKRSYAPVEREDGEGMRFVWLGVRVSLDDGCVVFWHKSGNSVSVQRPGRQERYRSGRETGRVLDGEKSRQSLGEFCRTHSPGFVGLVLSEVERVLSEER